MDLTKVWKAALGELEVIISRASFTTWFKGTYILNLKEEEIILAVPNAFSKKWISEKYHGKILLALKKRLPLVKEITYQVAPQDPLKIELSFPSRSKSAELKKERPAPPSLKPEYTFDSFVVGKTNDFAYATAKGVAGNPGKKHNPLFVYGGVGLGKTHLLQAIGNEILTKERLKKVVYVSCETFTNDFIRAIQTGKTSQFKKNYREIDVLLVDDVQFLANKEGSQEEFFHTYNTLHQTNRQIVITADRTPKNIPGLEGRLSSRFSQGIVADIQPPNFETRVAILKSKCQEKNFLLEEETVNYIAKNIHSNIRELEGALARIIAFCDLNKCPPSVELATKVLKDIIATPGPGFLTIEKILIEVSRFYHINKDELLGKKRNKEVVYPRQIAMYLLRHELGFSYPLIAKELGGKDHTTIIHGCKKIGKEITKNQNLKEELSSLKEQLYAI